MTGLLSIAARVAQKTASECMDESMHHPEPVTSQQEVGQQEQQGYIKKTPGKGYCVKSEKNPDWSGGCYPSKGEAKDRLKQVEKFKHMKKGSRTASEVKVTKFEWDPGDKRSYGSFEIEADTSAGKLIGKGLINSGGESEDEEWSLDGKPIPDEVSPPDLGIPHYYAGSKAMSRFEKVKDTEILETLQEWLDGYVVEPVMES